MEVEGRPGKIPRNKVLAKFSEKKANKKRRLRKTLEKRKAVKEMQEEVPGKDWKQALREKFESVTQNTGPNLAFGLSRLFKEENRGLMARVVEKVGDETSIAYAKQAIDTFMCGGIIRTDGKGQRSLGGIFFQIVKDAIEKEDPMKLKAIFFKSQDAKKRKSQARKMRKQANKQGQLGVKLMNPGNQTGQDNPFENVFNGLVCERRDAGTEWVRMVYVVS